MPVSNLPKVFDSRTHRASFGVNVVLGYHWGRVPTGNPMPNRSVGNGGGDRGGQRSPWRGLSGACCGRTHPRLGIMAIPSCRCWFHEETALHVTVHGYFLVTFLFGAVVLALVAWKICTLSSAMAGKQEGQSWKAVFTVLGLSSLVGVTWGLAILTPLGLSTIYVFALLNSLQGEPCRSGASKKAAGKEGMVVKRQEFPWAAHVKWEILNTQQPD